MDWLIDTLQQHPEISIFLAMALGYWLGSLKLASFSLGSVTGTLLMGVLVGPKVMRSFSEARVKTAFLMLKEYEGAYTRWVADNEGDCPENLEALLQNDAARDYFGHRLTRLKVLEALVARVGGADAAARSA